ncbi:hypothetical protein BST36_08295 [Mycolicibacterium moriokaense]|uniref:Uncharacterized protein n=1 Tax=Mycolicibacterium moriokaense TaxID=39691 RepID=A0AAD1M9V1_9MYCO|nr:LLM class flavin-dependent oxidoreductase [Mycolicibacterium moriokaense]ORB25065.1 hypothetical protein BST36_08295 [Mycolicibacterium moriokaense]BBX04744.1 hypothetical protein MMOR_56800 [Mycolicibacterium moriokaense]
MSHLVGGRVKGREGVVRGLLRYRRAVPRDDLGPPTVWVDGQEPRMLRLAGTYGDGWVPAWPMSPSDYGESVTSSLSTRKGRAGRYRNAPYTSRPSSANLVLMQRI